MKTTITLNGSEIRIACVEYLTKKYPDIDIDWHDLKISNDGQDFIPVFDNHIQYTVALKEDTTLGK